MTPTVADTKAITINLDHVTQVNDLLQRVLKGSVNEDQMQAIAIAVGSGQNPSTTALARMVKIAYARDPEGIKKFLTEQAAFYDPVQNVINCDADPIIPPGLKMYEHQKYGKVEWSEKRFSDLKFLYLDPVQAKGNTICGHKLRQALKDKSVMNASVLDWLLVNNESVPKSWKDKFVFFWGTIYSDEGGELYVRYLHWSGDNLRSSFNWLGSSWQRSHFTLLSSF